jgi:hypothetical protein
MVRARLPAPQYPGMQSYICRKERLRTAPCHADVVVFDIEHLLWQGRRVVNPLKETNGAPTSREHVAYERNVGSPTAREGQGDGIAVVVVGVTSPQGDREDRSQGEAREVFAIPEDGAVRAMRTAEGVLGIIRERGFWPHAVGRPWPFAVPVTTTSLLGVVYGS